MQVFIGLNLFRLLPVVAKFTKGVGLVGEGLNTIGKILNTIIWEL